MSPLLWEEGREGCPHSTQVSQGNLKPHMKQFPVAAAQGLGVPVPHTWHGGSSRAPQKQQAPVPAAELSCTQPEDTGVLPSHRGRRWHRGCAGRRVLPVGCTVPGAHRPARCHQLLAPSCDGLGSLCLCCCLCHASGLPCWCFPRDRGQHQDETRALTARTSHVSSFAVQGQHPPFHRGQDPGSWLTAAQLLAL